MEEAIDRIVESGRSFLLALDFDGTLAPIVAHPDDARPDPEALRILRSPATSKGVEVVIVSGRGVEDLRERLGEVPRVRLVGEHGNDFGEAAAENPLLAEAETLLRDLASQAEGAVVETKTSSVAFHYRNLDPAVATLLTNRIRSWAELRPEIRVLEGKEVIELSTATRNKGDAIAELAAGRPIIYAGDDVTDETVFAMLGTDDVGIKVGEGPTVADYRVQDIAGVVRVLTRILLASR